MAYRMSFSTNTVKIVVLKRQKQGMSQTGLNTRINIITTPCSILYKSVKYIENGKMILFFRIGP